MSGPVGKNPEKRKYIDLWLLASLTFLYYFSIFYADTMNRSREQLLADILKSTHEPQPITDDNVRRQAIVCAASKAYEIPGK
jgi:hypothetical protein